MNPSEIKSVMAELGGGANKRLGQHFLIDPHALATMVEEAEAEAGDRILEVGPGLGVLTGALIQAGASVAAVERDHRFAEYLKKKYPENLELVMGDASKLEWESHFKKKDWKFVSNLPYSITSLALRKALYAKHPPANLVVLVQREVAERAVARDQKHSLLSLMVAFASHEARIVKRVAAGAFFPPPKVESAILRIIPMTHEEREAIWGIDPEKIMSVAKRGFAHPRKLLTSNLGLKGEMATNVMREAGIPEKARAEDLSPENWVKLTSLVG
ncbi:16S rRNA (adenine(1518)-N(6)/adenine(1519)-N(6))-dimethyltransferase RsmA [Patescibacteria group bacterium]|jgi:16S rRNA (adenine1518-N6/adenine1519-N6)-dimethyltransferase|nr:16S rRNA (adenine(1518)-N(6)/adenine(1519)-N(6))-dimethyltransferase RsmA [Patescibacteria group bacterium]